MAPQGVDDRYDLFVGRPPQLKLDPSVALGCCPSPGSPTWGCREGDLQLPRSVMVYRACHGGVLPSCGAGVNHTSRLSPRRRAPQCRHGPLTQREEVMVSEIFDPVCTSPLRASSFRISPTSCDRRGHGAHRLQPARVPQRLSDRRPSMNVRALDHARQWSAIGPVLITGNGPSPKDGGCSARVISGYAARTAINTPRRTVVTVDPAKLGRLHILEVQRLIRFMPKVVIAVVPVVCWRRAQPPCRLRHDPRERRARHL